MSKTVSISFGDRWFWAYDVSFSILLIEAIHVAESVPPNERAPWIDNVLADLADAIVSMVRGDLPSPPPARVWFFGVEGGPRTL